MAEETNHNDAGEVAPSTVDKQAPSVSEEHAPSTDSDVSTDIPTANAPDPKAANPEVNPDAAGEKSSTAASTVDDSAQVQPEPKKTAQVPKGEKPPAKAAKAKDGDEAAGDKPAAKAAAKKEKAPAVEDKPFAEFIQQDYFPALKAALTKQGVQDLELNLVKQKIPIAGLNQGEECSQITGRWQGGRRQFYLYFPEENIQGQRGFSCAEGNKPSTLEPFLIDERKVTLDLMVFGVVQRLNAQKWLARN